MTNNLLELTLNLYC